MNARKKPIEEAWERVLVRHVVAAKRDEVGRLSSLLRPPFPRNSSGSSEGGSNDISILARPSGRWLMAPRFAGQSWIPLFSNAAAAKELFEANAPSRRLEVAWIGFRPEESGWFFRLHRAGKPVVDFAWPDDDQAASPGKAIGVEAGMLDGCRSGEDAFQRLCAAWEISLSIPQIRAADGEFQVIGARGKPVKTGLRGYVCFHGPEIAEGEDDAATALAEAIEDCDVEGIHAAIEDGASLTVLPDTFSSPLVKALFRCDRPGWKECVEALLEHGCPIDGLPHDDPPILDCVATYVPEDQALKMLEVLVARGAEVNATNQNRETALERAVVHRRVEIVRFLMQHGADPHMRPKHGVTPVEWVRTRLQEESGYSRRAEYAEILSLLTGEPAEQPVAPVLDDALQAENKRFLLCRKARVVLDAVPEDVQLQRIKASRLAKVPNFSPWEQELLDAGFEPAGHFVRETVDRVFLSTYVHSSLRFGAILASGGFQGDGLRCEVAALHPDGAATVAFNFSNPDDPDFPSRVIDRKEQAGASPAQLVKQLQTAVKKKPLVAIDAESFEQHYADIYRRLLQDFRDQAAHALANPTILIDAAPPRYERLEFYLDLSRWDDPAFSSQKLAESSLKDLARFGSGEEPKESFGLELLVRDAMELVAMRHFQFAGAPKSPDFVALGSELALAYFQRLATRRRRQVRMSQVEELTRGLLLAALAGRWDTFRQICNAAPPKLASAPRDADDPPREYAQFFLVCASAYRQRAVPKLSDLEQAVERGRPKRPRLLLDVWRAVRANRQADYEDALCRSLEEFTLWHQDRSNPNAMLRFLPLAESVLNLAARQRGLAPPNLPAPFPDLLITPESIGMSG